MLILNKQKKICEYNVNTVVNKVLRYDYSPWEGKSKIMAAIKVLRL